MTHYFEIHPVHKDVKLTGNYADYTVFFFETDEEYNEWKEEVLPFEEIQTIRNGNIEPYFSYSEIDRDTMLKILHPESNYHEYVNGAHMLEYMPD